MAFFKMKNPNVDRFANSSIRYLKFIGFEFESKSRWMKILLTVGLLNVVVVLIGQFIFIAYSDVDLKEKTTSITYVHYFLVALGKIAALLYNRKEVFESLNEFRQIYPSVQIEKVYNLEKFLKTSLLIEKFLKGFFKGITSFFCSLPLLISLFNYARGSDFSLKTPLMLWYPIAPSDWLLYIFTYIQETLSNYEVATIILSLDLCLYSCLLQLCMHLEIINRNVLGIETENSEIAEWKMAEQIIYHQRILRLANRVNDVFTPSVLFSLLSSSFIICFAGYQLLGDISILIVIKAFTLLGYELKQVIITCFLGDKLIETSGKLADAIYEHEWYKGTPKYKRMVLMILMRSQHSVSLNIAGISDVSLQTLRQVMSISYQIFTVLKTGST